VTPQRVYQLAGEMKRDHGPMGTDDAICVIAHMKGLDLSKYGLGKDVIDRVRTMVPRPNGSTPVAIPALPKNGVAATGTPKPKVVRIDASLPDGELLLSARTLKEAGAMAKVYPMMYLLENSVRTVIMRVMASKHGKDWWDTHAPAEVCKVVRGRKDNEEVKPWHGKRGVHGLYYSDFSHLKLIIQKNWTDFQDILSDQQRISRLLEDLEQPRNTIAHHNPISDHEQKRIEVAYGDWMQIIANKGSLVPKA
jgi:hypothetical protein